MSAIGTRYSDVGSENGKTDASTSSTDMRQSQMLPYFDAHNHLHLGLQHDPPISPKLAFMSSDMKDKNIDGSCSDERDNIPTSRDQRICGMALMSTHPRDFEAILETLTELNDESASAEKKIFYGVPCFGVHPWFLHETLPPDIIDTFQEQKTNSGQKDSKQAEVSLDKSMFPWLTQLEHTLLRDPDAVVGEIGLDGFHFDCHTRQLTCPMDIQVKAFEAQLALAHKLSRPVSIHAVQCWQPLMTSLSHFAKQRMLPRKMYFHAFGAKLGFTDQLLALVNKSPQGRGGDVELFFGFAPIVNFRSPDKTRQVMRRVTLERIVLESDHEDSTRVEHSLKLGAQFLAETFDTPVSYVVKTTWKNAQRLYGLSPLKEEHE